MPSIVRKIANYGNFSNSYFRCIQFFLKFSYIYIIQIFYQNISVQIKFLDEIIFDLLPSRKEQLKIKLCHIQYLLYQMKALLVLLLVVLAICAPDQAPVIGIYTQSDTSDEPKGQNNFLRSDQASNYSYIAASYVKYIHMSGAQVVPIFAYSKDKSYFDKLLPQLNGVLFPGGGQEINIKNIWTSNADYILKYAINQTNNGNPFPVWGTCLGWQLLAYLTSGYDSKTLSSVRGESGVVNTLKLWRPSYLFDDLSDQLRYSLSSGAGLLYFNHVYAVLSNFTDSNQQFKSFWNVVSTTTSSYNQEFISGAESRRGPFYGIQFHPEKNLFEWKVKANRSDNGAQIVQILSNKFIQQARLNKNRFSSQEEFNKASIYNYKTQKTTQSFTEIYLFKEVNSHPQISLEKVNLSTQ